jgi:hypothetical protein
MSYLVVSDHGHVLASGRPVAPGDSVPSAAVNASDPHDRHLIDSGVLSKLAAATPTKKEKNA